MEGNLFVGWRERVQDVRQGPACLLYMLTDSARGSLLRRLPQ